MEKKVRLAIIGLGYVGLPLAQAFAEQFDTLGYDVDETLIKRLQVTDIHSQIQFTDCSNKLAHCNCYIVTVPTPLNKLKQPDLTALKSASEMVGKALKKGDTVIYESTVYPGCTEEDCIPILEKESGLQLNIDFWVGYSPERINVGDSKRKLADIVKVTSGSSPAAADWIASLYRTIITAGVYQAPSIKVAEAAKAIENAQRDVNISFVNELSLMFDKMGIDTHEVLDAAATKWNFFKFEPGLVGGHCIGVDPYYLSYKSNMLGYVPQVLSSGRDVNERMAAFVAGKVIGLLEARSRMLDKCNILVLGITFKENCDDIRNSGVVSMIKALEQEGINVDVFDPKASADAVQKEYGIVLLSEVPGTMNYDAIVLAVPHTDFEEFDFASYRKNETIIFDIKGKLDRSLIDGRL